MYSEELTISNSPVPGLDQVLVEGVSPQAHVVYELDHAQLIVLEAGYTSVVSAGTLSSTIIIDGRKTDQTAVTIVTAGAAGGMLHLRAGEEKKQTGKIVKQIEEYCQQQGWAVSKTVS